MRYFGLLNHHHLPQSPLFATCVHLLICQNEIEGFSSTFLEIQVMYICNLALIVFTYMLPIPMDRPCSSRYNLELSNNGAILGYFPPWLNTSRTNSGSNILTAVSSFIVSIITGPYSLYREINASWKLSTSNL